MEWKPIETAPRDGTEVLLWRADAGVFLGRWTCPNDFLTDAEIERLDLSEECAEDPGWFFADFVSGDRCDGDLAPTLWMPLPPPPETDK